LKEFLGVGNPVNKKGIKKIGLKLGSIFLEKFMMIKLFMK
jgi:hypothetical protein